MQNTEFGDAFDNLGLRFVIPMLKTQIMNLTRQRVELDQRLGVIYNYSILTHNVTI